MIHPKAHDAINQAAKRAAFMHWFGLRSREAEVLTVLLQAKGEALTPAVIARGCNAKITSIMNRIYCLRQAMNTEAIDYELGRGYRLTEIGLGEATQALTMMAASLCE